MKKKKYTKRKLDAMEIELFSKPSKKRFKELRKVLSRHRGWK